MFTETTEVLNVPERQERLKPILDEALAGNRTISIATMPLEDWLVLRSMIGIGGSDVTAALGMNEFKTPYELWKEKVGDEINAKDNDLMWFGREVEDVIAKGYSRMTGREVMRDPFIRIHPEHDHLFTNLDRIITDNGDGKGPGVLECKSTEYAVYKTWLNEGGEQSIPMNYYCQIQHELSVTGFLWAILAVLVGRKIFLIPIERDEEYIKKQNYALNKWYEKFVIGVLPPERTAKDFAYVDPISGTYVEGDEDIFNVVDKLRSKQAEDKLIEMEIAALKDKVKEFIGDNESLVKNGEVVATYKTVNKKEYTVPAKTYRELRFKKEK